MPVFALLSRRFWLIMMLAALLQAAAARAESQMPEFEANYEVRYGILSGQMSLQLERRDSEYAYRASLRPRGFASWLRRGEIIETSTFETADGVVRVKDYIREDSIARPSRYARYVFDRPPGRVSGEYKSRAVDVPMRPGGHNRISAQVAIMRALQVDAELDTVAVFDRGRWRDFEFEVLPGQTVDTPSGRFDTVEVRYASVNKQKSWSLYCAATLDYLPVMIVYREDGKTKSRAELTDYRLIDTASSD